MSTETLCVTNNGHHFRIDRATGEEGWTATVLWVGNCQECGTNPQGMLVQLTSTNFGCPSCEVGYEATMREPSPDDDVRVTVFLSNDFRETSFGWTPDVKMDLAIEFWTPHMEPLAACEVAFAVCNSYPATGQQMAELHCDGRYIEVVEQYRSVARVVDGKVKQGWRSLSVGDVVEIDVDGGNDNAARFTCDPCGFSLITPARVRELREEATR